MSDKFPVTPEGYSKMEEMLKHLKTKERPAVIQAIAAARELGDLSENAEYHAAREKQSFIEGEILDLEDKIARADVIDITKLSGEVVKFGASVSLADEDTDEESHYKLVGEFEADIEKGFISINSPLGRALIGKTVGDSVEVQTPKGFRGYELLAVEFRG